MGQSGYDIHRLGSNIAWARDTDAVGDARQAGLVYKDKNASLGPDADELWRYVRTMVANRPFPVRVTVDANSKLTATGIPVFIAKNRSYRVIAVSETHQVPQTTGASLNAKVEICDDGVAAASGTDLLGATDIDLMRVDDTPVTIYLEKQTTSLVGTGENVIKPGQHLKVHAAVDAGTATATNEYEGVIVIWLEPVLEEPDSPIYIVHTVTPGEDIPATGHDLFVASDRRYQVKSIKEVHQVVQGAQGEYLQVERCQGTEEAGAGDDLLGAQAIDLTATINTVQSGTIVTTSDRDILEVGDRLVLTATDGAGSPTLEATTTYSGTIVVELQPYNTNPVEEKYICVPLNDNDIPATGLCAFIGDNRRWRIKDIDEIHSVVESGVTNPSLMVELAKGTKAATSTQADAINGQLFAVQGIDLDATANTVQSATLVTTDNQDIIENNDRVLLFGTDDDDSDNAVALTNIEGLVQIRLERVNDRSLTATP